MWRREILVRQGTQAYAIYNWRLHPKMKNKGLMILFLCGLFAVGDTDRAQSVEMSALPASQRTAIVAALMRWDRQLGRKLPDDSQSPTGNALVDTVRLGRADENDLVLTDRSSCSPTGNCSILVLRPAQGRYRVVLDGIGQTYTIKRARTKGFRNIELSMHGSATESTIKAYKFNGSRYVRAGCYNVIFAASDGTELDRPQTTPCR